MAELSFGARGLRGLMAAGMIFSAVTQAASESVTLSTYYPAPSGAYTQIITAGNAYLARDWGSVGIGTSGPSGKFDIEGAGPISLNSGSVGIGSGYATTALTLDSSLHLAANGASPNRAQIWWGDGSGLKLHFGTNLAGAFKPRVTFVDTGYVGIGTTNPSVALEVNGSIKATAFMAPNVISAWCNFNGATAGTNACRAGFNVTSVTRTAVGNYTINWTTPFLNANYAVSGTCVAGGAITNFALGGGSPLMATAANVVCLTWNGSYVDPTVVTLIAIGQ